MKAKSKQQQMAAAAALSAIRGKREMSGLEAISRAMAECMTEKELEEMASPNRENLPEKQGA